MKDDASKLSGQDSLALIEQMIGRARAEEKDSGMGWIIWGWLLFIASLAHYIMIKTGMKQGNTVWMIFGVVAFLLAMYEMVFRKYFLKHPAKVKTYTNELVNRLGTAFFISLMIMVYGNYRTGINNSGVNFGYLLLLYGFWMFIHGSAFRYRLLIYGAVINWAGAGLVFYFGDKLGAESLLVHAFCVALGYLVPGHTARKLYSQSDSLTSGFQANP